MSQDKACSVLISEEKNIGIHSADEAFQQESSGAQQKKFEELFQRSESLADGMLGSKEHKLNAVVIISPLLNYVFKMTPLFFN